MIAWRLSVFVVFSILPVPARIDFGAPAGPASNGSCRRPNIEAHGLAALKAVAPFGGRQCDLAAGSAPMQVGAEFAVAPRRCHRGDNAAPDDKGPDVVPSASLDELLHGIAISAPGEMRRSPERADLAFRSTHANPLRTLKQLDDDGRATRDLENIVGCGWCHWRRL